MNNLYQELNQQLPSNLSLQQNPMVQAFKAIKNSKNPQQMLMNMAQQNPQTKQIIDMINSSGQSPKDLFYQMAKQKGVDPNQILNMLK